MTLSSLNDIIKSTHAIDAKGGRLPIGIPGRLQIGMHGRLRRNPQAGDSGAGAAPVVPDSVMMSATRLSFGSINKTVLLSSLTYPSSLVAGTWAVTLDGS